MEPLLNTLYVTTEGAYLYLDHDTVRVEVEHDTRLRVPLLHLAGFICFGNVRMSSGLLQQCAEDGRSVVFLDRNGRFKMRLEGPTSGNVLLRQAQHAALSDPTRTLEIARACVAGKLQNSRQLLMRAARESLDSERAQAISVVAGRVGDLLARVETASLVAALRGHEGDAARSYFSVFDLAVRTDHQAFRLDGRTRRPALALDIMEELRPVFVDRLALTLINRRQLKASDFVERPGGSVLLTDDARRSVIVAYQKRKQEEIMHRVIERRIPLGLVPHIQARLLSRHLRGDLASYPPFLNK